MNKRIAKAAYIESGKWDEQAIDQFYDDLLELIGDILDRIQLLGLSSLFDVNPMLQVVKQLFELMEKELLLQWKVKQDAGLAMLFERQKQWLNHEKRASDGLFALWGRYCALIWERLATPAVRLNKDPWKAAVLEALVNRASYGSTPGFFNSNLLDRNLGSVCALLERLYYISPHHQVLSFLNLVEMGTGDRPEICEPGMLDSTREIEPLPSSMDTFFNDVIDGNRWQEMPDTLCRFWDENSGGEFSLYPAFEVRKAAEGGIWLKGIQPDRWSQPEDPVGMDDHLQQQVENILAGKTGPPGQCWEHRGSEVSSTVRTLLARFAGNGLRVVYNLPRGACQYTELLGLLKDKKETFIFYLHDRDLETVYKMLKSDLENGIFPIQNCLVVVSADEKHSGEKSAADPASSI